MALGSLLLQDIYVSRQMAYCTTCSFFFNKGRSAGSGSVLGSSGLRFQYYPVFL